MSLIVFSMINLVGDPVDMLVNPESLPDEIDRVRKDFGLDQPVHIQYWKFLTGALSGDLGNSFIFGRPALSLIAERFPATVELATCALFIAVITGLPLGIYAGLNPNGLGARMIMGGSVLGISIPTFWLGLMMIIVFSVLWDGYLYLAAVIRLFFLVLRVAYLLSMVCVTSLCLQSTFHYLKFRWLSV